MLLAWAATCFCLEGTVSVVEKVWAGIPLILGNQTQPTAEHQKVKLTDGVSGHCVFQQHAGSLGGTDSWILDPCVIESSESSGILGAQARSLNTARVSLVGVTQPGYSSSRRDFPS